MPALPETGRPLTLTEERMLRVVRAFAAESGLSEHGRPILSSRLRELVLRLAKVRQPPPVRPNRAVPEAGAAVPKRVRPSAVPPPPAGQTGGVECEAACGERSIGWRFYVDRGWLPRCGRHLSGAGPRVRRMDADRVAVFGPGGPAGPVNAAGADGAGREGPVAPALSPPDGRTGARGPSGPSRPSAARCGAPAAVEGASR
jgi:hypothetical protein